VHQDPTGPCLHKLFNAAEDAARVRQVEVEHQSDVQRLGHIHEYIAADAIMERVCEDAALSNIETTCLPALFV
jgi:hypothetical protein